MVIVKLTKGVGSNILTWGLGGIIARVYQTMRELISMNSVITKSKQTVSNN